MLSELRRSVKVVLLAARPTPPELSAALPLKLAGTVAARKMLPLAGVVTEAIVGATLSIVRLRVPDEGETLPAASVAVAVMLCVPLESALVVME